MPKERKETQALRISQPKKLAPAPDPTQSDWTEAEQSNYPEWISDYGPSIYTGN